jgi:branched-chain amino acid transport system substrate-binding protein
VNAARHRRRPAAAALAVVLTLSGCTALPGATDRPATVAIGLLSPASGSGSAGDDAVRGAQLAIDLVNNSHPELPLPLAGGTGLPGLNGAVLTLAVRDTAGSADQAETAANDLVTQDHAAAIVAADSATVMAALGAQAQRLRVPLLDATSSADYLPEMGLEWYFRISPSDRTLVETAYALLRRELPADQPARLAVLQDQGGDMATDADLVRELATRAGYSIVATLDIGPSSMDLPAAVRQLDESGADAVLAVLANDGAAKTAVELTTSLTHPVPLLGLGPGFLAVDAPTAGDQGSGAAAVVLRAAPWSADFAARSPAGLAVAEFYRRRFGANMSSAAASAFTATITLAVAIDTAASADSTRIRAALRQIWLPATAVIMPWNGVRFDASGQNQLAAAVIEARLADGYRVVFPRELASRPVLWTGEPQP